MQAPEPPSLNLLRHNHMGVIAGIVVIGVVCWAMYAKYVRVIASKRYGTRQIIEPDVSQFSQRAPNDCAVGESPDTEVEP